MLTPNYKGHQHVSSAPCEQSLWAFTQTCGNLSSDNNKEVDSSGRGKKQEELLEAEASNIKELT